MGGEFWIMMMGAGWFEETNIKEGNRVEPKAVTRLLLILKVSLNSPHPRKMSSRND